jgi:hypothetical protein
MLQVYNITSGTLHQGEGNTWLQYPNTVTALMLNSINKQESGIRNLQYQDDEIVSPPNKIGFIQLP